MEEHVGVAGQAARAAHHRNALPLARRGIARLTGLHRIELDVIADEKIQVAVAIVIEERAARAPTMLFVIDAGFARDVGKCAVAVVVKQNVVAPEAAEEIVPAVVVVIADADAGLPAGARQSGSFGDVGERAVAIVLVQMRSGRLSGRPRFAETRSVREINIEPAVVIVIEEGDAAAFGLDDVALVIGASPDVWSS